MYNLFNVEDSAKTLSKNFNEDIYGSEIAFGNNSEVVGEQMATVGSFHGVFNPFLDPENKNYVGLVGEESYQLQGAQELKDNFQDYIYNFMQTGNPNDDNLTEWAKWNSDITDNLLLMAATKDKALINTFSKDYTYSDILSKIADNTSLNEEEKETMITQVLNGRWVSYELGKTYNNLSIFQK